MTDAAKIARKKGAATEEEIFAYFWRNVEKLDAASCWPWIGKSSVKSRGLAIYKGFRMLAPRLAYWIKFGIKPPADKFVCHSCDNPSCCNPAHLWLGTVKDNNRDMFAKGRGFINPISGWQRSLMHCQRGHEFTPENTIPNNVPGRRKCRTCNKQYQKEYRAARRRLKNAAVRAELERIADE